MSAVSNSLSRARSWSGWRVAAVGIDTASYAWRPDRRALDAFLSLPGLVPGVGGSLWLPEPHAGARIGIWPTRGLLVAEGRLAAMCGCSDPTLRLLPPAALSVGHQRVVTALSTIGIVVGEGLIRRCDAAGDWAFDNPDDGVALLRAVSALSLPRYKRDAWHAPDGTVETVYFRTRGRGETRLRFYDASVCHKRGQRGSWLRVEAPLRWRGAAQPALGALRAESLQDLHLKLLRPWLHSDVSRIVVARGSDAKREVEQLCRRGQMEPSVAARFVGFIDAVERGTEKDLGNARTLTRWRKHLRDIGICPDGRPAADSLVVDVRPFIAALRTAWRDEAGESW